MRPFVAFFALSVALGTAGCNYVAPFDPMDQRPRPIEDGGGDYDEPDAAPDAAPDASECARDCDRRSCGPDGCGGLCGSPCGPGQVCVFCPSALHCDEEYHCAAPAAGQWIFVRAGERFSMGSPEDERGRDDDEPLREVLLTHDFIMSSSEVTQGEMLGLDGRNLSWFSGRPDAGETCGDDCPAEHVTWLRATEYANLLSGAFELPLCYEDCDDERCGLRDGLDSPYECEGFRLPTEAEWEYAARADSATATPTGDFESEDQLDCLEEHPVLGNHAWFCGNSDRITHPVASLEPNAWGFFDMLGNVSEWCHDVYVADLEATEAEDPFGPPPREGSRRVIRGGSFDSRPDRVRSAHRAGAAVDDELFVGVRLVRTVQ